VLPLWSMLPRVVSATPPSIHVVIAAPVLGGPVTVCTRCVEQQQQPDLCPWSSRLGGWWDRRRSDLTLFWSRELSVIHKLQLNIVILRVRAW